MAGVKFIQTQLGKIQKLGAHFRQFYPDWRIVLLANWREESGQFIREICHEGGGQTLAVARVEVPEETFYHFHTELKSLGERSIGDYFLFTKQDVVREPFEIFEEEGRWARRSRFLVEGYPLTITEYFTQEGLACLPD